MAITNPNFKIAYLDTKTFTFGNINSFAFEIEQGINPRKGYMRLWITGTQIGEFKIQSEYVHAIRDFSNFFQIADELYEPLFSKMTPLEIAEYVLAKDLVRSGDQELLKEAGRRQKYVRFFGDQFDSSHGILSFVNGETFIFIIWYFKKKVDEVKRFEISLMDYKRAVSEFVSWFNTNLAGLYPSYMP